MEKKWWIIIGIVVIILVIISYFLFFKINRELITVTGIYEPGKGGGTVGGVFLVYPPENASEYLGKNVEVTGYAYDYECKGTEQCYGGKYMDKIVSIKIIE